MAANFDTGPRGTSHHIPGRFLAGVEEVQSKRDRLAWKEDTVRGNSKPVGKKKQSPDFNNSNCQEGGKAKEVQ